MKHALSNRREPLPMMKHRPKISMLALIWAAFAAVGCGDSSGNSSDFSGGYDDGGYDDGDNGFVEDNGEGNGDDGGLVVEAGCYIPAYAAAQPSGIGCGLLSSFGDPQFDARFSQEVALQSDFWGLSPAVYIFDECPGDKNALSNPQGFILFGLNLTIATIIETGSDLPLAGVLAHEWAHQVQFTFGWSNTGDPTVRTTELEADAFSGYYMGLAKGWAGAQIDTYFQNLFNTGDYQFNEPNHHGTPDERVAAGALGLMVANQVINNGTSLSYEDLHQIFRSTIGNAIITPSTPQEIAHAAPTLVADVAAIATGSSSIRSIPSLPLTASLRAGLFPHNSATGAFRDFE